LIRWQRLARPGIAPAMNAALRESAADIVLFVDDDVVPEAGLLSAHLAAHAEHGEAWAVAGQVLQPGQVPVPARRAEAEPGLRADLDFPFHSTGRAWVRNVMAGNLSVRRAEALRIGGFDENFVGVAYRFETEFARRIGHAGGRILFEPAASIRHLRAPSGGTRSYGNHLRSASPYHGAGDYYFALREGKGGARVAYVLRRILREVTTRYHARHPWFIPVKIVGELRALALALRLYAGGPHYAAGSRPVASTRGAE
jgi:GT2 family glycosyltransferase